MKTCRICGEEFTPQGRGTAFCPRDHYRPCKHCGKTYLVKKVVRPPEFCSGSCSALHRHSTATLGKTCLLCGQEFTTSNPNAKYCDRKHERTCATCGDSFPVATLRAGAFCSRTCAASGEGRKKTCARCGKAFVASHGNTIYCGDDHYSPCEHCGTSLLLKHPGRVPRYCSPSCAAAERSYSRTCALCGKRFTAKKADARLCGGPHEASCVACGRTYPVRDKYQPASTCSPTCASTPVDLPSRNAKTVATLQERYGVSNAYFLPSVVEAMKASSGKRVSKVNLQWAKDLRKAFGQEWALEVPYGAPRRFYADLGVNTLLLDVNPAVTHNSTRSFIHLLGHCQQGEACERESHQPKARGHHQERFLTAEAEGKLLLQHFPWYDRDLFLSVVRAKLHQDERRVGARQCELRVIPQREANAFLRENHLLGAARGQTHCVGLFYEGELAHCHTYGPARLTKKFEWEAIRSCSKRGWLVRGGFSRCDRAFFREVGPKSVVSYVDLAISTGATELSNPGWKLLTTNPPSATWVRLTTAAEDSRPLFLKDASVRRLSADRLLGLTGEHRYPSLNPDGSPLTNEQVLLSEGYVKCYDAGTRTFGWREPGSS